MCNINCMCRLYVDAWPFVHDHLLPPSYRRAPRRSIDRSRSEARDRDSGCVGLGRPGPPVRGTTVHPDQSQTLIGPGAGLPRAASRVYMYRAVA